MQLIIQCLWVLGLLSIPFLSRADDFVSRFRCNLSKKPKVQANLTFLDCNWDQHNDANGLVMLQAGGKITVEKANVHLDGQTYTYVIDALSTSPVFEFVKADEPVIVKEKTLTQAALTVPGSKSAFDCSM